MIETEIEIKKNIKEKKVVLTLNNQNKNVLVKKKNISKEELNKIYKEYSDTIWLTGC